MKKEKKSEGFTDQYLFVVREDLLEGFLHNSIILPLFITDIGLFPYARYHFRQRHEGCKQNILLYCVQGSGYYRLHDQMPQQLSAYHAVVIPAGTSHEYAASEDSPWSIYWMHFDGASAKDISALLDAKQPVYIDTSSHEEIIRAFYRCFEILKRPYQIEEYYTVCQYASLLLALTNLAGKQAGLPITSKGSKAVDDAIVFMKKNLHRSVTLAEIAAAANFSASHLHCLFKTSTGYAPMEYFVRIKMQAAGNELFFSSSPVKEIAAGYGLSDSCYFSRVFKKTMGVSPLEYRNLVRG